jgi:hypothetical protein
VLVELGAAQHVHEGNGNCQPSCISPCTVILQVVSPLDRLYV